jgi:2,4-didehydro-3-deoxy-L-rhamnonate hydrolase
MRLVRYGPIGRERPGIIDHNDNIRALGGVVHDIDATTLSPEGLTRLRSLDLKSLPIATDVERLGPCIARPGKFICIGLNYADHAAETGAEVPAEPVIFLKATSSVSGPNDCIIKPRGSTKLDWEVELAFVIGSECLYKDLGSAQTAIAGYCVCHDVSERAFQFERGGQWDKGKGCDSFGPIGPWLVTTDELADTNELTMWLDVNGRRYQSGSTRTMIFKPPFLVHYLSQFMSLQPGDIVTTGTPPGVGLGQKPPTYLNAGDVVTLGIAGLGTQRQTVVDA